jgi:hypothetical protein
LFPKLAQSAALTDLIERFVVEHPDKPGHLPQE